MRQMKHSVRVLHLLTVTLVAVTTAAVVATSAGAAPAQVTDGNARFQIITPTLLRLEYAADGRFEDRATQTLGARGVPSGAFTTSTVEIGRAHV